MWAGENKMRCRRNIACSPLMNPLMRKPQGNISAHDLISDRWMCLENPAVWVPSLQKQNLSYRSRCLYLPVHFVFSLSWPYLPSKQGVPWWRFTPVSTVTQFSGQGIWVCLKRWYPNQAVYVYMPVYIYIYVMLCYAILSHVMLCYVILLYIILYIFIFPKNMAIRWEPISFTSISGLPLTLTDDPLRLRSPLRITITKTYNDNALFEDLKALCIRAGVKGESVTFIFTDAEIKSEAYWVGRFFNNVITTWCRNDGNYVFV